ncbi:hypothetical protein P3T76_008552 [Phytophthora citrophthora]|uniref:Uncharacterized protein n=1 Tax=Phytophthora citrophthora TaxID=4793 RepID=A0AAD9GJ96_9STRA|nr:hypothetical protein P3T76_008552 [Phytophthora citrophthora]
MFQGFVEISGYESLKIETGQIFQLVKSFRVCRYHLGIDWYTTNADVVAVVAPPLTVLFNWWFTEGCFPPSFLDADKVCLVKGGNPQDSLNYQPLSSREPTTRSSRE